MTWLELDATFEHAALLALERGGPAVRGQLILTRAGEIFPCGDLNGRPHEEHPRLRVGVENLATFSRDLQHGPRGAGQRPNILDSREVRQRLNLLNDSSSVWCRR